MNEDIVVYLPDSNEYIVYYAGDGSNLLNEDLKEGYVDYINYDIYKNDDFDPFNIDESDVYDGGLIMYKERLESKFQELTDAVHDVLEMAGYPSDVKYEFPIEQLKELKMKATGKNISEQFIEVLYKLENTNTPLDDNMVEVIMKVPEIQVANNYLNSKEVTINLNRKNRWMKWAECLLENKGFAQKDEIVYNNDVEKGHKAFLVLGLPASGKSSVITNKLLIENRAVLLDSDEAKKIIPEYDDGWGAGAVHEESKEVNVRLQEQVLIDKEGPNVVIPTIGSDRDKIKKLIDIYKMMGYTVSMHLVEVKPQTSMSRLLRRFISENRFIDPMIVINYGNKPSVVFEELKGEVDEYVKWSNEVKRGEPAVCVCKGGRGIYEEAGERENCTDKGNIESPVGNPGKRGAEGNAGVGGVRTETPKDETVITNITCKLPWSCSLEEELINFAKDIDFYHFSDECQSEENAYAQVEESLKTPESIDGLETFIDSYIAESELPEVVIEGIVLLWRLKDLKNGVETETSALNKEFAAVKYQLWNKLAESDLYFDSAAFEEIIKAYTSDQKYEDKKVDGQMTEVMISGYSDQEIESFITSDHFEEVVCSTCKMVGKLK